MTEVALGPAGAVTAVDFWGDAALDDLGAVQVEPRRWWVFGDVDEHELDGQGSATAIGGGLVRAEVRGRDWRDFLAIAGYLDLSGAEPGEALVTVIHHVPVTLIPDSEELCRVYFPASYAETLTDLWRRSATCDTQALQTGEDR